MTTEGSLSSDRLDVNPYVFDAVVFFAERAAALIAEVLDRLIAEAGRRGDDFDGQGLPPGFLLELSAVAQLAMWKSSGLAKFLPKDLPDYRGAAKELNARVQSDPRQFDSIGSAILSRRLMQVWLENCSWTAPHLLGVDVTSGLVDEDLAIEALAQILWKYRRSRQGAALN